MTTLASARAEESPAAAVQELSQQLATQVATKEKQLRLQQSRVRGLQLRLQTGVLTNEQRAQIRGEHDEAEDRARNIERECTDAKGARDRLARLVQEVGARSAWGTKCTARRSARRHA